MMIGSIHFFFSLKVKDQLEQSVERLGKIVRMFQAFGQSASALTVLITGNNRLCTCLYVVNTGHP